MREHTTHRLALLVTDDAAVETAIRHEAATTGDDINLHNSRDALSIVLDGCGGEGFAVVDLGQRPGGRRLMETAGGSLPVLAITGRARPWLSSMARHHRVGATLKKPFSVGELHDAWQRVRTLSSRVGSAWQ